MTAVLAVAVTVGVLLAVAVWRLGREESPGDAAPPPRATAPRLHTLPLVVAGKRVSAVAAADHAVVYGTEDGGVYTVAAPGGPARITGLDGRVVQLALDPTGRWLAAASARGELAVADTRHPSSPVLRRRLRTDAPLGLTIPADQLAIDSTGSRVAAQTAGIGVYDLHGSGSPHWLALRYECSGADDMAFVGTEFIAAFGSCADVWDASTLRLKRQVFFPSTGFPMVGHDRIVYGTFRHALLLDHRSTSPLPSASAVPGQPRPGVGSIIADKTIGTRRGPIYPMADDGRVTTVLQNARLIFWHPASHRVLGSVPLPFPVVCPSTVKPAPPAQFDSSFSPGHRTLVISARCPPRDSAADNGDDKSTWTYRRWMLTYPSP
ncbi:hypothetical protein AB0E10_42405 [Streptomyces sp. NPDC048045]|uniref:hypothetical protein n=1 Tax=Streptomyces sp. NPDC048045 TaxID=3154710 RepID=UPI003438D133